MDVTNAYAAAKNFLVEVTEGSAQDIRLEEVVSPEETSRPSPVWGLTLSYIDARDGQPIGIVIAGMPRLRQYRYVDVDAVSFEVKGLRIRDVK